MHKSESIAALAAALSKAQGEMGVAKKDAVNPHFKSKYADLASVWDAAREPLAKNGLAVTQTIGTVQAGHVSVVTTLMHASGEFISGELALPASQNTAQGFGSAITYARRYALAAICGIAADDDDGNEASRRPNAPANPEATATRAARAKRSPEPPPAPPSNGNVATGLPAVHPVAQFEHDIGACTTPAELGALAIKISDAKLSKEDQARLRPVYKAKKAQLEPPPDVDGVVP